MVAFTIFLCWTFRREDQRQYYDFGFGAVVVATFLVAPLSWLHHYVFLIPALAAYASILNRSERRDSEWSQLSLLLVTILLSMVWPEVDSVHQGARVVMTLPISGPIVLF